MSSFLKNSIKFLFIMINIKIILLFLFAFKITYLTPLIITLVNYINIYIYNNICNIILSNKSIIKQVIITFIISSLICITKYYISQSNLSYDQIKLVYDFLLGIIFVKDTIYYSDYFHINNIDNSRLLSNNVNTDNSLTSKNDSGDEATPTRGRSPDSVTKSESDINPTRDETPKGSNRDSVRSISPRSLSSIIDESYSEAKQGILRFFGNTFYVWDKPVESNTKNPRFAGAIQEVETNSSDGFNASYKDSNGNTWVNPNGSVYTNEDELRSVINLRGLAVTPSEKANLEKAINSIGGPIMFTENTNGDLIFYRSQKQN